MSALALLTISKDGLPIKSVSLDELGGGAPIILGRGEDCAIRLDDRAISRQHALFSKNGNVFQIEKKSEFAPLSVNGEEKMNAVLKAGDVIAIGPYLMKLSLQEKEEKPAVSLPVASEPVIDVTAPLSEAAAQAEASPVVLEAAAEAPGVLSAEAANIGFTEGVPEITGAGLDPAELSLESVDDSHTSVISTETRLEVSLVFQANQANVTEYRIVKDEVFIGRGKNCDVILADKRASRKSAVITRSGSRFVIRDLGASNGVMVNGERVDERDLSGGDQITIGDTAFVFKAVQPGYSEMERKLTPLPDLPDEEDDMGLGADSLPPYDPMGNGAQMSPPPNHSLSALSDPSSMNSPSAAFEPQSDAKLGLSNIAGIAGVGGVANKKLSIVDKYKALPPARRIMVLLLVGAFVWFFLDDSDIVPAKKPVAPVKKVAQLSDPSATSAKDAAAAFAALNPEQKKFVESQHELAFGLFQRKEYDRAIDEVSKIFTLVPDYKDSREIERYAREGKRRLDAALEERHKREQEEAVRQKVASLVVDAGNQMGAKKYDAARELFTQIIALDPENKSVVAWQHQLQDIEEERKIQAQRKIVQQEVNAQAWALYKNGVALRKKSDPRAAVAEFGKVPKIEATDRRPAALAKQQIEEIHEEIRVKLLPLLDDAKKSESSQDYVNAMHSYEQALRVDSSSIEANEGMERLRGILHERGKVIFTEAIIAESYSDFPQAKKKFQDCLQATPADDSYHARCERKLARYFDIGGGDQSQ
jgi:pSer/pThr/pTyr-binding forkhead associated (FHA) protein/tetratricopeptide (TPR) repeat protein